MAGGVRIEVEDDPTPMVLILAATLRRAVRTEKLADTLRSARGSVALKSTTDPQAATIRFADGTARVERGAATDADVTIATDVNALSDEHPPKPKVSGAARHPKLALAASKLLEPPQDSWQIEAGRFWAFCAGHPGVPSGIRVVCRDDRSEITLGSAPPEYELQGRAHALASLFCGNTVLGQEVLDGKLYAVGALSHTAELTGRSIAWMLGG
ncbi:MAG TPA: hypothetical protein VGO03_14230 [Acidimicrobiia bacterium]|jgi:hypothetical protein